MKTIFSLLLLVVSASPAFAQYNQDDPNLGGKGDGQLGARELASASNGVKPDCNCYLSAAGFFDPSKNSSIGGKGSADAQNNQGADGK